MEYLTNTGTETPAYLSPVLFREYIDFIDRGERTTQTYINNLRQFMAFLLYREIRQPGRQDIIAYRDYLGQEHAAICLDPRSSTGWNYRTDGTGRRYKIACRPNTIAQYLRTVCQFFRWTAASGYYPNIAENIHPPKIRQGIHRKEALTVSDVKTIEESIAARTGQPADKTGRVSRSEEQGRRLLAMYTLSVNAGLRTIEISRAKVRDLETRGGRATLYIWGKGHTEPDTRKPIAPQGYRIIRDYLDTRETPATPESPLFCSTGNRSGGQAIAPTTISKMLKKAMQAAGYDSERITAHSLRHTAGTHIQGITHDLYITQKYMRHANPATTEIYLHNDTEGQEAEAAEMLYNLYHGIPAGTAANVPE